MPVNIDTVYQTVQALANKEQRGYITPQEFNLFANQAQQDIFEQYFYDINAFREQRPQDYEIGDSVSHILIKLRPFYSIQPLGFGGALPGNPDAVRGKLFYNHGATNLGTREMKELSGPEELYNIRQSRWHNTSEAGVFYFKESWGKIQVWTRSGNELRQLPGSEYPVRLRQEVVTGRPRLVNWGYVVVNEEAVYDPGSSTNFQLHHSEQPDLVIKILTMAGISTEDAALFSAAKGEEQLNLQQENK
tara:strand:+ start:286 stop:1026 length:741 start_codon:yes stop_codon:yes gene_type:complete